MTSCGKCTGIHWQVAQATSITNVYFKSGIGSQNQGLWMENGSGGFISDLTFEGGLYGMWVGNQQFTARNITIKNTSVASIYLNWNWVWTFKNLKVSDSPVAIDVAAGVGSVVVIDSQFTNTPIVVRTVFGSSTAGANSVLLDNVVINCESAAIVQNQGQVLLRSNSSTTTVKSWAQGHLE